jgi:inorganic pyrophosphatase
MSYDKVPAGKNLPEDINVIIEIPANSSLVKYEIDKNCDAIFVDRFMKSPMFYPANYGYINKTLANDGDALDVLVMTPYPLITGSVIRCRPVGILNMIDECGEDAKLISVPHSSLTSIYNDINNIDDVPSLFRDQVREFFENYKNLESGKWVKIKEWQDSSFARKKIMEAALNYQQEL